MYIKVLILFIFLLLIFRIKESYEDHSPCREDLSDSEYLNSFLISLNFVFHPRIVISLK